MKDWLRAFWLTPLSRWERVGLSLLLAAMVVTVVAMLQSPWTVVPLVLLWMLCTSAVAVLAIWVWWCVERLQHRSLRDRLDD